MSNPTTSNLGLKPLDAEGQRAFQSWRALALTRQPYFASILFGLTAFDSPGLGTMAVDGRMRLYIDVEAVSANGPTWCAETLLHECGHIFKDHATLAKSLGVGPGEQTVWNLAADAGINCELVASGCQTIADDGVLPSHLGMPDFLTSIEYFRALQDRLGKNGQQSAQAQGSEPGEQDSDPASGGAPQSGSASGEGQPFAGCGSASGGAPAPSEIADGTPAFHEHPGKSPEERDYIRAATAAAIVDHANKAAGSVPGSLVEQAEQFFAPSKVRWEQVLSQKARRSIRMTRGDRKRTYRRRDRRFRGLAGSGIIRPGRMAPRPRVHVIRDVSGSMDIATDLLAVTREVEKIAQSLHLSGDDLLITDYDAGAHVTRAWKDRSTLATVSGRGGTDMGQALAEVAEKHKRNMPDTIIVATDGYTPWDLAPRLVGTEVIVCIIAPKEHAADLAAEVPSWMDTVAVEPERTSGR